MEAVLQHQVGLRQESLGRFPREHHRLANPSLAAVLLVEKAYHRLLFVSEFSASTSSSKCSTVASLRLTKDEMDNVSARILAEGFYESLFASVDWSAAVVYVLYGRPTSGACSV
jgi:hypothetical protein